MRLPQPPLLLITDRRRTRRPLEEVVRAAIGAGCRWVSLREKDLPAAERLALLRRLLAIGRAAGARVTVHEDIAAAEEAGADGVHLPGGGRVAAARARLGPDALIGISAHAAAETVAAGEAGADYATLSPVWLSPSKPGYGPALGPETLRIAAHAARIPVLALGGVGPEQAAAARRAGAAGVAVMGGVMAAADPAAATARLIMALSTGLGTAEEGSWT